MEYMEDIKYHPLVDLDTAGRVKQPMFASTKAEDMERHELYLEEIIPHTFRLCSTKDMKGKKLKDVEIQCPSCGRPLKAISSQRDGKRHGLYICRSCSEPRGR